MNNIQIREYVLYGARFNTFTQYEVTIRARKKNKYQRYVRIPKYRMNSWMLNDVESSAVRMLYGNEVKTIVRMYTLTRTVFRSNNLGDVIEYLIGTDISKIQYEYSQAWKTQSSTSKGPLLVSTVILYN